MRASAEDSLRVEPAAALIGSEIELPVVLAADGRAPLPGVFAAVWTDLAERGWTASEFGVSRAHPSARTTLSSAQLMSTDTGPVFEIATPPCETLDALAVQVIELREAASAALDRQGCRLVSSGVHPAVRPTREDYYRFRTPRPAYDYAIGQRGWRHWSIVDKAAVQEIVDVTMDDAPRAVALLHRLSGLMNFVLRNDPGPAANGERLLSVRPLAWRSHVPHDGPFAADARMVLIPPAPIEDWRSYLAMLWDAGPMFLVGTKSDGQGFVPAHPTFLQFLRGAARGGWDARLLDGSPVHVEPEVAHVAATDWSYMGYARIRWKWRADAPGPLEIAAAWDEGRIEELLPRCLEKVVVENRSNSTQPEGEEIVSVALVAGLLANLDEASAFASAMPYAFWLALLDASTRQPLRSAVLGRDVPGLAGEMIGIAARGLRVRGERDGERWLAPLRQRLHDGLSPSERRVREDRR